MSFKDFFLLEQMTNSEAEKILGLGKSYTMDDLKSAYKKAAFKNHPDRGGSDEIMKQINLAHEKLNRSMSSKKKVDDWMENYRETKRKAAVFHSTVSKDTLKEFDEKSFLSHFEEVFGEKFDVDVESNVSGVIDASSLININFSNHSKSTVLSINIRISLTPILKSEPKLSSADFGLDMFIQTEILHNRRKIKLTQKSYNWSNDKRILSNPERLFPKKKLSGKKDQTGRPMSKRDIILSFQKELGAKIQGDWALIPCGGSLSVGIYRTVFSRLGAWSFGGIYDGKQEMKDRRIRPFTYIENGDDINYFIDEMKKLKGISDASKLEREINRMNDKYKEIRSKNK